jgi:1-acyl-sn-glycerol-3-phosphate acyltransferase
MKPLLKFLQCLYSLYAVAVFTIIMLLIFPFVIIASFFGRIKGGNITYRLCMLWGDLVFPLIFIFPKRSFEAPHDKNKPYIFVTNHISYLDACLLVEAFRQPLRILGKVEMTRIPVFGFIYKNAVVTVDRSSAENRAKSIRIIRSLLGKGISVLFFPEGTFNKTAQPLKEFYDGAFRIAIETQTPIKPVLFPDNFDFMPQGLFSLNPAKGKCRIVYLDEIPVTGLTIRDVNGLKQKVFDIMSEKLRAFKVSWINGKPSEL